MAIDPTVNQVLTIATTQVGLRVTLHIMVLIPMMTLTIIRPASVQLLVVLRPLMAAAVRRRPDWTTTLAMNDLELRQKMQMALRYHSGGAMYLVFLLAPVLGCLPLAWLLL